MILETKEQQLEIISHLCDGIRGKLSDRNHAIYVARANGATLQEIATAAGMTRQGIAKILSKRSEEHIEWLSDFCGDKTM